MRSGKTSSCLAGALCVVVVGCSSSSPATGGTDGGPRPGDGSADTRIVPDATDARRDARDASTDIVSDATATRRDVSDTGTGIVSDATATGHDASDTGTGHDASDGAMGTGKDSGEDRDAGKSSDAAADSGRSPDSGTKAWTISGATNNLRGVLTLDDDGSCVGAGCANFTFTPTPLGGNGVAFTGWTAANGSNYFITKVPPLAASCGGGTAAGADVCWNGPGQANQSCTLTQVSGGPVDANVASSSGPQVTCTTNTFLFSGTVLNLATGNTITVQDGSAANQVAIAGTGAATANFTLPAPILSGSGPFPAGGYSLTFAGTSTGGTVQSIGPIATDPTGGFQVNGAVPQVCTITAPALPYVENANVTPANGPVITCESS